jgi:hypothetical protein
MGQGLLLAIGSPLFRALLENEKMKYSAKKRNTCKKMKYSAKSEIQCKK